ncbi:hypothetical protein JHK82_028464 [Glycine max]|nr:hypothetical protein JHK85_029130 [Glycine max]KAG5127629.1 hypothetical protein JHK82_028464 [Glycine max]
MLLFNAAGVELTKKVLIREVFMLENQIPFHVLEQISGEKIIQSESKVLPNHTVHWLDLMYHLIVPRSQPQPQPQPEPEPQAPDPGVEEFFLTYFGFGQWEILALPLEDSRVNNPLVRSLTQTVANLMEITERRQTSTDSNEGAPRDEKLPSAKQLRNAGIFFKPAERGISSIDFDDKNCVFTCLVSDLMSTQKSSSETSLHTRR